MVYSDECALTKAVILVIDMVRVFEAFKTIPVSCAWNKHHGLATENEE